jgi:WSC domain
LLELRENYIQEDSVKYHRVSLVKPFEFPASANGRAIGISPVVNSISGSKGHPRAKAQELAHVERFEEATMFERQFRCLFLSSLSILVLGVANLAAQYAKPPDAYSISYTESLMMPNQSVKIYRDAHQVVTEEMTPRSGQMTQATHTRDYLNLNNHEDWTLDLADSSIPCGMSTQGGSPTGDWSGNPFEWLSGFFGIDLTKTRPPQVGTDTVAGMKAKVFQMAGPGGQKAKIWVDEKYGLLLKMASPGKSGGLETMLEVKSFTVGKPPASVFAMPARCAKSQAASPAASGGGAEESSDSKKIAAETGENPSNFVLATNQQNNNTATSCTVLFRIVHAGTMAPITSGFTAGIDLKNPDNGNPPDVTSQFQNGVLPIENAPARLGISFGFGEGGGGMGSFPRQCFGPRTVLLLVVKNPQDVTEGTDFLWVKSGKYATIAAQAPVKKAGGYLGCFNDQNARDLPTAFMDIPNMTNATCQATCRSRGFTYAGTQYGSQCFCGNSYGKYGQAGEEKCNMPCAGNGGEKCGGTWANSVFKLKK